MGASARAAGDDAGDAGAGEGPGGSGGNATDGVTVDTKTIWVMRDGTPRPITIHAGLSDGSVTEVVDGDVSAGDQVAVDTISADGPTPTASPLPGGGGGGPRRLF